MPSPDAQVGDFARLEDAIRAGDRRQIREAMRNLDRLGIEVRFTLPVTPRGTEKVRPEE
jgi:hypothetical protein